MKSVEQKIYEAWRSQKGLRLTAGDVQELVTLDDAIRSRLANAAAKQLGFPEPGTDMLSTGDLTWKQLGKLAGTGQ